MDPIFIIWIVKKTDMQYSEGRIIKYGTSGGGGGR